MNLQEKLKEQARAFDIDEIPQADKNKIINLPTKDPDNSLEDIVPNFAIGIQEAKKRFQMLQDFVKEMMVAGQDYGVVSGVAKPTLLKPGAEKLTEIFGFSKKVSITNRMEDWAAGLFAYEVKVSLTNKRTGHLEAEGLGSCNTKEQEYVSQNPFTIANTMLKMAKKRALIDAVLSATRSSSIFTQDVENKGLVKSDSTGETKQKTQSDNKAKPSLAGNATEAQLKKIEGLLRKLGISSHEGQGIIKEMFGFYKINQLNKNQASSLIQHLLAING